MSTDNLGAAHSPLWRYIAKPIIILASVLLHIVYFVLIGFAAVAICFHNSDTYEYQLAYGKPLRTSLGFAHGSPYIREGGSLHAVSTIQHVTPGGLFERAGFQPNDIPINEDGDSIGTAALYKLLHSANGGPPITITVVRWREEKPINLRKRHRLTVQVPAL